MAYFNNSIKTIKELKSAYHKLALKNHPDVGGDIEVMKAINVEYDTIYAALSVHEVVNETASESRNEFYTAYGWKGENYDVYFRNKDIAKFLRDFLKKAFPKCKFSVCSDAYSINVTLMKADFDPFRENFEERNCVGVMKYRYDENLSEYGNFMFRKISEFLDSYRFDDSDAMVDYFCTNFYYFLSIGQWDKPFVQTANNKYAPTMAVAK